MKYGLSEAEFLTLDALLITPLKKLGYEVWLFGSRANGSFRKYSDIDILIVGNELLDLEKLSDIKEKLQESNLPYQVDIVNERELAETYRQKIDDTKLKL